MAPSTSAPSTTASILERASEKPQLAPGDNVWVDTDILMTHDVCGPGSIGIFKQQFGEDSKSSTDSMWNSSGEISSIQLQAAEYADSFHQSFGDETISPTCAPPELGPGVPLVPQQFDQLVMLQAPTC